MSGHVTRNQKWVNFVFAGCAIVLVVIIGLFLRSRVEIERDAADSTFEFQRLATTHMAQNTKDISEINVRLARWLNQYCTGHADRCFPDGTPK